MADAEWTVDGVLVHETTEQEWVVDGVLVAETTAAAPPAGIASSIISSTAVHNKLFSGLIISG